jgi:hypothetical protein
LSGYADLKQSLKYQEKTRTLMKYREKYFLQMILNDDFMFYYKFEKKYTTCRHTNKKKYDEYNSDNEFIR